ncbi:MAG: GMC family oxidoreductase [Cyanobacteria bacterium P01_A01_bin.114]
MLIPGKTIGQGETLHTDVCIVGAGAAGLTLAHAFEAAPFSVLLLESGGFQVDPVIQSMADGTTEGMPYPFMTSRARCFGGSTTRWTGVCIPLDAGDFQQKSWLPHSGWPFDRSVLLPYYRRAQQIFGLSALLPPVPDRLPFHQSPLETKTMQYSCPRDLGRKYKRQIVRSRNVTLITHANVTELIPDGDRQRVAHIDIRSNHTFKVIPKTVILATGGIENARLLLASNTQCANGLGNSHDLVGRFFMEHYFKVIGILPVDQRRRDTLFLTNRRRLGQTLAKGTFGLNDELREQRQLLNLHTRLYRYSRLEDTATVAAAKQLQLDLLNNPRLALTRYLAAVKASRKQQISKQQTGLSAKSILPRYVSWHYWNKFNLAARFDHVRLLACIEQEPDPNNRITLSQQRDCLGQSRAHLTLRFSDRMWASVEQSLWHIDQALQAQGFGPLQYSSERLKHLDPYNKIGLHHMGTTRMHDSPHHGVVDANCRVHDLANLYVAGSSVFPTGGAANPTFTIAALALRLADHIYSLYTHSLSTASPQLTFRTEDTFQTDTAQTDTAQTDTTSTGVIKADAMPSGTGAPSTAAPGTIKTTR